jgi:hypothetical protein
MTEDNPLFTTSFLKVSLIICSIWFLSWLLVIILDIERIIAGSIVLFVLLLVLMLRRTK